MADEQLAPYFDGMDINELYAHQIHFISAVAGGPADYTGDNMREAHAHLDIDGADFDTVGRYLETALRENGIGDDNIEANMAEVVAIKEPILGQ